MTTAPTSSTDTGDSAAADAPALPVVTDLVDGEWAPATLQRRDAVGELLWVEHASTGTPSQPQAASDAATVERALAAAHRVHAEATWRGLPDAERAVHLDAMADHLEGAVGEVAVLESVDSGATLTTTSMLGFILHGAFRLAAEQLRSGVLGRSLTGPDGGEVEVSRLPWGPALLLCPWNAPAPMAAHKAASALAAGCPVVIKPPERAPHGTAAIGRAAEAAGLPAGVVQLVHGGPEVASVALADDRIRCVSFTGGLVGGRAVAHACAEGLKPAQLELGGHGPLVVLDDATPEQVAAAATALLTTLNGQWCRALGRLLLPESRREELLEAVVAALSGLSIGDPLDPATQMGPIVHSEHLAMLRERVAAMADAGGSVVAPASLPDRPGNWMSPTLVEGLDPSLTRDEVFGPIASVHTHRDDDEAVALANGTDYGLEAYVIGSDTDRALSVARRVLAGEVKVNGTSPMNLHLMAPRPAFGLSGLHDEGTTETIEFFSGHRVVGIEAPMG
jgi:phenylacetaldehyde dehydrogenase